MKTFEEIKDRVRDFSKQGYNMPQLCEIVECLKKELDIEKYINIKFHWLQIRELKMGLESGINVKLYADSTISNDRMVRIRYSENKKKLRNEKK